MTEDEIKAVKWIKSIRDDAVVTLDHIQKNELHVSPMLYAGRKQKAETIITGFEELEAYRAIGTVDECAEMQVCYHNYFHEVREYRKNGTADEFKALKEKDAAKKPIPYHPWEGKCPSCSVIFTSRLIRYCGNCGQRLDWS